MFQPIFYLSSLMVAALTSATPVDHHARHESAKLATRAPWQPAVGTAWQIVLSRQLAINSAQPSVTPDVPVFDIDMFGHNGTNVISSLHSLNKKVICYFSAGSYEDNRPDRGQFPESAKGNVMDGWPDEKWLNINDPTVQSIMANRIKLASQMGCDAVDPDNVDGYAEDNDTGFDLTEDDAVRYIQFMANEAKKYNMGIGLKNALAILPRVAGVIQFAVNEQCVQYNECDTYDSFVASSGNNKPVFHIEYKYNTTSSTPCKGWQHVTGFSTALKKMSLDGYVKYCDAKSYTTATK